MLSDLTLLERVRDIAYLDPRTWLTFFVLAGFAVAGSMSLTRRLERGVIALRNRFVGRWTHPDQRLPTIRREAVMLYTPAIAGALMGPVLAFAPADVGFYLAHDDILEPARWDWVGYALVPSLALLALCLITLVLQLLDLFRLAGLMLLPFYGACALTAFAAGATGAPLVLLAALHRGALLYMPVAVFHTLIDLVSPLRPRTAPTAARPARDDV